MNRLAHALAYPKPVWKYIYFIQCEDFTKIGIATNLNARAAFYEVHNPFPVRVLASFKSDRPDADEELLHTAFEFYLVRGEWFKLPKRVIQWLEEGPKSAQELVDKLIAWKSSN